MAPKLEAFSPLASNEPGSRSSARGRGRGRGRGHGRGRGRSTRAASPSESPPSSPERNEFLVHIRTIHRWLKLPKSFAQLVIDSRPSGLWLALRDVLMGLFG